MFFLIFFICAISSFADEILTSDGRRYEGIVINQSPAEVTVKVKDKRITLDRSDLKALKRWTKKENDALAERWVTSEGQNGNLKAREEELKFADSVRYSDQPWEVYEEDAFIAFHHQEGIIRSRLEGKVGDFCREVAEKLGYKEFKIYDKKASPDWNLKFKFYSYRDFKSWRDALDAAGLSVENVAAFAASKRRVIFYELYMDEHVVFHEISHEIYNEFIKNADIPRWWSEGVAEYAFLEKKKMNDYISTSKVSATNGSYFLEGTDLFADYAYPYGLSAVCFLIKDKGKEKFKEFSYSLRAGRKFKEALFEVYGFKDIRALEEACANYLKKASVTDMVEFN